MPNSFGVFDVFRQSQVLLATLGLGSPVITPISTVVSVAGDASLGVVPPAGQSYLITTITTRGDGVNSGYAFLYTGANPAAPFLNPDNDIGEGDDDISCMRDGRVFVTNTVPLGIFNENVGAQDISYCAIPWNITSGPGSVRSGVNLVAAGALENIQVPAGQTWLITTITTWGQAGTPGHATIRSGVGAGNAVLKPAAIGDGNDLQAAIRDARIPLLPFMWLSITNEDAGPKYVSYSGVQWK